MRTSLASLRKALSMALSNSPSSTSTRTFTLLPSRGSTEVLTGPGFYRSRPNLLVHARSVTERTVAASVVCSLRGLRTELGGEPHDEGVRHRRLRGCMLMQPCG